MQSFWIFVLVLTFGCRSFRCEDSKPPACGVTGIPRLPPPDDPAKAIDIKFWVIRVYQDPASPPVDPIHCGPYETSPDCGSMRTQIIFDGTSPIPVIKTAGLNTKTGDVDLYTEHLTPLDEITYVWKATLTEMKLYSAAEGIIKDIETIPPELQLERDVGVVLVAADPNRRWILYGVCNRMTAWVAVPDNVIAEQKLDDAMNAEIDAAITNAGFDPKTFRNLETRLPEAVGSYIPLA